MENDHEGPPDIVAGYLAVGRNDKYEVVLNLDHDRDGGVGHIVFSPNQAKQLARLLEKHADEALADWRKERGSKA